MAKVHSTKDDVFVHQLCSRFGAKGLDFWFAPKDMKGGAKLIDQIDSAISQYDKLLLVLSEESMKSDWVATEIYKARQKEKKANRQVLFPISLCSFEALKNWQCFDADSGKDMAREIREYYIPDFSNWKNPKGFEERIAQILKDLQATVP